MTNNTEHPPAPDSPVEVGQVQWPFRPDVERVMRAVWDLVRSGPNFDGRQRDVEVAIAAAINRAVAAERDLILGELRDELRATEKAVRDQMIADGWRRTRYLAPVTDCEACLTPDACVIRVQCGHYLRERA